MREESEAAYGMTFADFERALAAKTWGEYFRSAYKLLPPRDLSPRKGKRRASGDNMLRRCRPLKPGKDSYRLSSLEAGAWRRRSAWRR